MNTIDLLYHCIKLFCVPYALYALWHLYCPMFYSVNNERYDISCSISNPLQRKDSSLDQDEFWTSVAPDDTVPFSFEGRGEYI